MTDEAVELVKVVGIIGSLILSAVGFGLSAYATLRAITSRKLSNYQEIIKSHRELWKLTLDTSGAYSRVLEPSPDLRAKPVTYEEQRFVNLLLLHMTSAFYFSKHSEIAAIEKLKEDVDSVLALPIPRQVWAATRRYFNDEFAQFVDSSPASYDARSSPALNLQYANTWNILVLSSCPEKILSSISRDRDKIIFADNRSPCVTAQFVEDNEINVIICFDYGRVLEQEVLQRVVAINIHCGLLPHHRGPNPNLWSALNPERPRGVSIHYIDEGIDTGDLIAQKRVPFSDKSTTLGASYEELMSECVQLMEETWPSIRAARSSRVAQLNDGSTHTLADQAGLNKLLKKGLDLPLDEFRRRAKATLGHVAKDTMSPPLP